MNPLRVINCVSEVYRCQLSINLAALQDQESDIEEELEHFRVHRITVSVVNRIFPDLLDFYDEHIYTLEQELQEISTRVDELQAEYEHFCQLYWLEF